MTTRDVDSEILRRHLGLPAGVPPDAAVGRLISDTRNWYRQHGDPWTDVTVLSIGSIDSGRVTLENGVDLTSQVLAEGLQVADAQSLAIVAVTAGQRVDDEVDRRWQDDRPDEAMFLAAYAGAIVEQLRDEEAMRLENACASEGKSVLPYFSPGYDGWDLADQHALFSSLARRGPLEILPSCFLRPTRSALAVVGICGRQPVDRLPSFGHFHLATDERPVVEQSREYAFPPRTLAKWGRERLNMRETESGYQIQFRFDGTTCSSMGMPLAIAYNVELRSEQDGQYRIVSSSCEPWEGDTGHRDMCVSVRAEPFMATITTERPLLDDLLDEVFQWQPDVNPAGCLCLKSNRDHKWRIVLQTIHYKLFNPLPQARTMSARLLACGNGLNEIEYLNRTVQSVVKKISSLK